MFKFKKRKVNGINNKLIDIGRYTWNFKTSFL